MSVVLVSWEEAAWITGAVLATIVVILAVAVWRATR